MEFGASADPRHTLAELPFRLRTADGLRDASHFNDLLAEGLLSSLAFCTVSASVNSGGQIALYKYVSRYRAPFTSEPRLGGGVHSSRSRHNRPAGSENEHLPRPLFIFYSSINSRPAQSHL